MSWLFSRALAEEFLRDGCLGGAQSAQSKSNLTPPQSYSTDKTRATLIHSRSGMTCEPLTAALGAELLTSFRGGFPCQDISPAGRGDGLNGDRSGLWSEFARIIGEVRSRYVFVENSAALSRSGLEVVLGDLASLGYDAEWGVLSAAQVGAPHIRERMWVLAYTEEARRGLHRLSIGAQTDWPCAPIPREYDAWDLSTAPESLLGGVVDGVATRVDGYRRAALGNGQVPACAAAAFKTLAARAAMR